MCYYEISSPMGHDPIGGSIIQSTNLFPKKHRHTLGHDPLETVTFKTSLSSKEIFDIQWVVESLRTVTLNKCGITKYQVQWVMTHWRKISFK